MTAGFGITSPCVNKHTCVRTWTPNRHRWRCSKTTELKSCHRSDAQSLRTQRNAHSRVQTFALRARQACFGPSWPESSGNITVALARTYMEPVEVKGRPPSGHLDLLKIMCMKKRHGDDVVQLTHEELKEEEHKKKVEAKAGRVTTAICIACITSTLYTPTHPHLSVHSPIHTCIHTFLHSLTHPFGLGQVYEIRQPPPIPRGMVRF